MNERQLDAEIARKAAEIAANEEVLKCAEDYSNNVYAARVAYREKGGHVANIELPTTRSLCDKLSSYNIRDVSSEKADIAERQCTRANELFFSWTLRIRYTR